MNRFHFFLFLLVVLCYACNNSSELPLDDKGREDFIAFHNKFYSDSLFQLARIEFPLEGNNPDGSKEPFYWEIDTWKLQKAIDEDNPDIKRVPFYDMEDVMRERLIVQNRFMIENLFSLINNKWYMTRYSGIRDIGYFAKKKPSPTTETEDVMVDSTIVDTVAN